MLLVDTSAFVDAHRRSSGEHERRCRDYLQQAGQNTRLTTCGICVQEIMEVAADDANAARLAGQVDAFGVEPATLEDHLSAARLFRACRGKGITPGTADVLVVAIALRIGATVFASDADFEHIRRVVDLPLTCIVKNR